MTKIISKLPQVKRLKKSIFLSGNWKETIRKSIENIKNIFLWKSSKKLLIIWPCSVDFDDSIIEYAEFLSNLRHKYSDKLEIVMRFYTWKPRSTIGWKWILNSIPWESPDLRIWVKNARKLAIKIIEDYNIPLADELLYPELSIRLWDLYSYMAIWARSTEDQFHREVASWLAMPIWIKNPCSWDIITMENWVLAVKSESKYLLERNIYSTSWNVFAHWVLRWWYDWPNYRLAENIESPIIVDCNHSNSHKTPEKQINIMKEVMLYNNDNVKWFMVESYLFDWRQDYSENCKKWLSLTDPCIWKEKTKEFIEELYKIIK